MRLTLSLYDSLGLAFTAAAPVAPRPADELRLPSAFKKNEQRGSVNLCKSDTRLLGNIYFFQGKLAGT